MNNEAINKRIQALETELAALKAELNSPEKFEFKYKPENIHCILANSIDCFYDGPTKAFLENFRYRQIEANALVDFKLQKELMCISALAEQIDPNYKSRIDWRDQSPKYRISYDIKNKEYTISSNNYIKVVCVVYMPKDVAEKVCEILNKKQVEL